MDKEPAQINVPPHDDPVILTEVEGVWNVVMDIQAKMPPCPECRGQHCFLWFKIYLNWVLTAMLGPYGFMQMFLALLEREQGHIDFTREELEEARNVLRVESMTNGDGIRAIIVERKDDFEMMQEYIADPNEEWPDEVQ